MDKVKEAWDEYVTDFLGAIQDAEDRGSGHSLRGSQPWPLQRARELMLAVHDEACEVAGMIVGESDVTKDCGDGWLCERAKAIKELAREA